MNLTPEQFSSCTQIVELLDQGNEEQAREEVIRLLEGFQVAESYGELVNSLIRLTGLLPYMQIKSASWQDRFAWEAFKVDSGAKVPLTLHREQSLVLRKLLSNESLALSAPTSFGKSFIIDAFIAIRKPSIVVIIVPTIALADETRRRLQGKFGAEYKIVTTAGVELAARSILVFPAERAVGYVDALETIDLLVVDEFYKADSQFDPERSPALLRAILRLSPKAKQRYFLAPNIKSLRSNELTVGMEFLPLDFRTVLLHIDNAYQRIGTNAVRKEAYLLKILEETDDKTLIYAGSHSSVASVAKSILEGHHGEGTPILKRFGSWLETHYGRSWDLPQLVSEGTGVHTGRLHRFLAQIQVYLFERDDGLRNIIATSSIIEGVNTQAKNVVIWKSKNGSSNLTDFTYRNIIGRGGRSFKHFVGNIYLLDKPPPPENATLSLEISDDVLNGEPENGTSTNSVTREQVARIAAYKAEMRDLLGAATYDEAILSGRFVTTKSELLRKIAESVRDRDWNGIGYLNSNNPDHWDRLLFTAIKLDPSAWDSTYTVVVNFIKALGHNWTRTIPELIAMLGGKINVDQFFSLERNVTFRLSSILADVNTMNKMVNTNAVDVSPFLSRLSSAFLPPTVFDLEEYGLPRMISRKIDQSGLIDLEDPGLTLHEALEFFRKNGLVRLRRSVTNLTQFDEFLLEYFLNGIRSNPITDEQP